LQISCLTIKNFRGIKNATIHSPQHAVLIGDNNTGKTTILEAIDLVLGPDRLNRTPPIDEHDFYQGKYRAAPPLPPAPTIPPPPPSANASLPAAPPALAIPADPPKIEIEVTISHLTPEQKAKFVDYVEFWDSGNCTLYQTAHPAGVDAPTITEALRVTFIGCYDAEEDDFEGKTLLHAQFVGKSHAGPVLQKTQTDLWLSLPALSADRLARAQPRTRQSARHRSSAKRSEAADVGRHSRACFKNRFCLKLGTYV
jgi:hypothetical protein